MSHLVTQDESQLLSRHDKKDRQPVGACDSYYRRLVTHLFKKERFIPDSNDYVALVPLRLTKEQWELLVNFGSNGLNLNEIDDLLDEVLKRSSDEKGSHIPQLLADHYRNELIDMLPRLNSPAVLTATAVLAIVLIARLLPSNVMSKFTFSAMIVLVFIGICGISFAMTYWDCLTDLEVEQMIQLSKKNAANNPCKDYNGEHESIWSSIRAFASGSSENKCLDHMRETFKPSKNYCDPLDVLAKWFGKIQMSYFNAITSSFLELISKLSHSSNFLTKIILWIVAVAIFVFFIYGFGKVVLVQTFKGVFSALNKAPTVSSERRHSSSDLKMLSSKMDEILHENQEMKRELSFIRECSVERTIQNEKPALEQIKGRLEEIAEESAEPKTT